MGQEKAFGEVGDVVAIGVGEDKFALEAGDDVVGKGLGVENGDRALGDEEEAVVWK